MFEILRVTFLNRIDLTKIIYDLIVIQVGFSVNLIFGSRVRFFNPLDFGDRVKNVKHVFIFGNFEVAGHLSRVGDLLDLGADVEPGAGKSGLALQFAVWHHNDGWRIQRRLRNF